MSIFSIDLRKDAPRSHAARMEALCNELREICAHEQVSYIQTLRILKIERVIRQKTLMYDCFLSREAAKHILRILKHYELVHGAEMSGVVKTKIFLEDLIQRIGAETEDDGSEEQIDYQRPLSSAQLAQETYRADKKFQEWAESELTNADAAMLQNHYTEGERRGMRKEYRARLLETIRERKAQERAEDIAAHPEESVFARESRLAGIHLNEHKLQEEDAASPVKIVLDKATKAQVHSKPRSKEAKRKK